MLRVGVVIEEPGDPADDRPDLVMSERPDQDAAGVVAICLCPLPEQRCEVPGVARHEDPGLLGGQLEHLRIIQRSQGGVRGEAHDVVAASLEGTSDALG